MMFTDTLDSFLMSYSNDNLIDGSQDCTIIRRSALFLVVLILSSLVPVCLMWFKFSIISILV